MSAISFITKGPQREHAAERCSFCGKIQHEVRLCAGPDAPDGVRVLICAECAHIAQQMVNEGTYSSRADGGPHQCSFCGKSTRQEGAHGLRKVTGVIAAGGQPGVAICNECIALLTSQMFPA